MTTNVTNKAPITISPIPVKSNFLLTQNAPARIKPMPKPIKAMIKISTKPANESHGVNKQTPMVNKTEPIIKSERPDSSFLDKFIKPKTNVAAPATDKTIPKYKSTAVPIPQMAMIMPNATKIAPSRIHAILLFIIKPSFQKEL